MGITITQGCNQSIDQQSYFSWGKTTFINDGVKISKFFAMPSLKKKENLLYQIYVLLLNNPLYHHVGLLSIKHRQYLPTALWPDETSSTPGKRLLLSNVCGFCGHIKKYKDFSLDLHILKPYDGVCNLLCHCYFLLFLCLLDAHYVLFNLIVIKFSKFRSYCSFRSTNSKQFNAIFWLAGKCGTPLFNNKPTLTWLSLKKTSFLKKV